MRSRILPLALACIGLLPASGSAQRVGTRVITPGSAAASRSPYGLPRSLGTSRGLTPSLISPLGPSLSIIRAPLVTPAAYLPEPGRGLVPPEAPIEPKVPNPVPETDRIAQAVAPEFARLADPKIGDEEAAGGAGRIADIVLGRRSGEADGEVTPAGASEGASNPLPLKPFTAKEIPSPADFFEHAKAMALSRAAAMGYGPEQVYFGEATAALPSRPGGESWMFTFYLLRHPAQSYSDQVTVVFKKADLARRGDEIEVADDPHAARSSASRYAAREYVHGAAPIMGGRRPAPLDSGFFSEQTAIGPDEALARARKRSSRVGSQVSLSLRMRRPDASGAQDLWYYVHDAGGAEFVVNGRTGQVLERIKVRTRIASGRRQRADMDSGPRFSPTAVAVTLASLLTAGAAYLLTLF